MGVLTGADLSGRLDAVIGEAQSRVKAFQSAAEESHRELTDTAAGISFPTYFAASTLDHDGPTYDFVSDGTRREFETQQGLTP